MVNSLLHEWVGRLSVTGKTNYFWRRTKKLVFSCSIPPHGADPLSAPSHCRWRLPRGGFMGFVGGFMGQNVRSGGGLLCRGPWQERQGPPIESTDAAPTQGRDPNHARLIQYICGSLNVLRPAPVGARCQPGCVSVALRFERAYDTLVTRFQLVSSSFPAQF